MDNFKFKQRFTPELVFTAKKLYTPNIIYIVMWEKDGELDCVTYPVDEAEEYIKNKSWEIIS